MGAPRAYWCSFDSWSLRRQRPPLSSEWIVRRPSAPRLEERMNRPSNRKHWARWLPNSKNPVPGRSHERTKGEGSMFGTKSVAMAVLAGSLVFASLVMTTTAGASTPGVTSNTITLGLITELTGPGATGGTGMVRSAQALLDQQNAEGGVFGRKIKLIVRDDGTNPATYSTATADLISKGVF